jgi:hypothetical protein
MKEVDPAGPGRAFSLGTAEKTEIPPLKDIELVRTKQIISCPPGWQVVGNSSGNHSLLAGEGRLC